MHVFFHCSVTFLRDSSLRVLPTQDNSPDNNRLYSHLFGYLLPCGFLFIPAIDAAAASSMATALHTTNALAIAVALLMLVPSLKVLPSASALGCPLSLEDARPAPDSFFFLPRVECAQVQVVTFLVFAGFRAFLYGVTGAYIGETFGAATLGRVTGCVFTAGSLVQLLQAPVVDATNRYFQGRTTVLALGMAASGACMVLPVALVARTANPAGAGDRGGGGAECAVEVVGLPTKARSLL
jgi:hypothetical protein